MGKIASFINSLKLSKNEGAADEIERDSGDDYAVEKKGTSFYVISIIVSILGAIFIWLFAVSTGTSEKLFAIQPELRGIDDFIGAAEHSGFTVVVEKDATVSFGLVGRDKVIKTVTNGDIAVYAELGGLIAEVNKLPNDSEQTVTAEIIIEAPLYFSIEDVSKKEITIKLVPINKVTE